MGYLVLIAEIMYYSLFMYYSRKDNILKYILSSTLVTIVGLAINTNNFISYSILVFLMMFIMKYVFKINIKLYNILTIILMLITKILIEYTVVIILFNILKCSILITTIVFTILKILIVVLCRNRLTKIDNIIETKWNNNNFYIRYFTTIGIFLYIIISIITILVY